MRLVTQSGRIIPAPESKDALAAMLGAGCTIMDDTLPTEYQGDKTLSNFKVQFETYAPFEKLYRLYPEARTAEEITAVALETPGFERFQQIDAESYIRYIKRRKEFEESK
jgi:hypothetical protein